MKIRLAALAFAAVTLVALTGCASGAAPTDATPSASSSPSSEAPGEGSGAASGDPSSAPQYTTPAGVVVPDGYVQATKDLFAEADPATTFEGAQMLCLLLDGADGDMDKMGTLMKSEMGLSVEQTRILLPLAVQYACPNWADAFNTWANEGGLDRL